MVNVVVHMTRVYILTELLDLIAMTKKESDKTPLFLDTPMVRKEDGTVKLLVYLEEDYAD